MANSFEQTFFTKVIPAANTAFGVSVRLQRKSYFTDSFTARRDWEPASSAGEMVTLDATRRVWYLPASSLVLLVINELIIPRNYDRIHEGGLIYEVLREEDEPAVELLPGEYEYLVKTKLVS